MKRGVEEGVLHFVRRRVVIHPHHNAHGVQLGWVMQIDDGLPDDLVVWDVEVDGVVRAQARRAPVDLHHFRKAFSYLEPIAYLVRAVDLERHASDDAAKKVLCGKGENDRCRAGSSEQTTQLAFRVIANAEHEEKGDEENEQRTQLTQKLRDDRLAALLEIKIPKITVDQRDDDCGAEEDDRRPDVIPPAQIEPIDPGAGIRAQSKGKELKEDANTLTGPPFQQAPE